MFTSRSSIDSETFPGYRFFPCGRGSHRREVTNQIAIEKTSFLRRATSRQQATGSLRLVDWEVGKTTEKLRGTGLMEFGLNDTWWRGPAVEHWSLTDVLSLSCARPVADG